MKNKMLALVFWSVVFVVAASLAMVWYAEMQVFAYVVTLLCAFRILVYLIYEIKKPSAHQRALIIFVVGAVTLLLCVVKFYVPIGFEFNAILSGIAFLAVLILMWIMSCFLIELNSKNKKLEN